jgi:hypothetical protein
MSELTDTEATPLRIRNKKRFDDAVEDFLTAVEGVNLPKIKRSRVLKSGPNKGKTVTQRDKIIGTIGRTTNFGFGRTRSGFKEFVSNEKYPEIFEALVKIGNAVVPKGWRYSAITLNQGVKAKKHKDEQNVGKSVILTLGDFTGGGIYVFNPDGSGRKTYDIYKKPLMFNGALLPHQTEPFKGERWTMVFYKSVAEGGPARMVGKGEECDESEMVGGGVMA